MKKLSFLFIMFFTVILTFSSCGDDDICYVCTGFDDGITSLIDLGEICVGDQNSLGAVTTEESILEGVQAYEAEGGTCILQ